MPYAPGVTYRAGDYFASVGPRIADNIQTWKQNREERDQSIATAEMLGRYLGEDPQAMEMFGDKLAQIPSMSTGAAKGVIGGVTNYLAQKRFGEEQKARTDQLALTKTYYQALEKAATDEAALKERDLSLKEGAAARVAKFNQLLGQELNPPLMFQSAAGPGPRTQDAVMRAAQASGILGTAEGTNFLNAMATYGAQEGSLPLGEVLSLPGGGRLIGKGRKNAPEYEKPTEVQGLNFGEIQETPEGTIIGLGLKNAPKFVSKAEKEKMSPLEQSLTIYSPVYSHQLDEAENLVKKHGAGWTLDAEARASFQQLPALLAASYAKVTDPTGVVREADIDIFRKQLFPHGLTTRPEITKAAIANLKKDFSRRMHSFSSNRAEKGKLPEGLPAWVQKSVREFEGADAIAPGAGAPGAKVTRRPIITPDGKRMEIRADQYEEALKQGFRAVSE
jgi:hypothetical protein